MANEKEYKIKISIDGTEQATTKLKKFSDTAEKETNSIAKNTKSIDTSFLAIGSSVAIAFAAFQSFRGVTDIMKNAAMEAIKADDSMRKVANSLSAVGEAANVDKVLKWADALEKASSFSAEAVQDQYTYARSLGFSNEQAQKLVQTSADLATVTGDSLESSMSKLIGTTSGVAGGLAKQNVELKGLTEEQLKAGKAVDILAQKFSGKAKQSTETFSGSINQMNVKFGDMIEEFGNLIIKTPAFSEALISTTKAFASIVKEIESGKGVFGTLAQIISGTASIVAKTASKIASSFDTSSVEAMTRQITMLEQQIKSAQKTNQAGYVFMSDNEIKAKTEQINKLKKSIQDAKSAQDFTQGGIGTEIAPLGKNKTVSGESKKSEEKLALEKANLEALRASQAEYQTLLLQREQLENTTNAYILSSKLAFYASLNETQKAQTDLLSAGEKENFALMLEEYTLQDAQRLMQLQAQANAESDVEKQKTLAKQYEVEQRIAASNKELENEKQMSALKLATANQAIATGLAFAKKGSREHKNLQRAQVIMSTYTAATQALSSPPGPPWTIPLAALVTAQGFANLRAIDQQKFATGGIFNAGGTSITGDNNLARLNDREMILNMRQQKSLFDRIDSGNFGGGYDSAILLSIRDSIQAQNMSVSLDGEKLNNKLDEIKSRRLGA